MACSISFLYYITIIETFYFIMYFLLNHRWTWYYFNIQRKSITLLCFIHVFFVNTMCPRSSSLFTYIVPYYIKWVTTSWTYSTWLEGKWIIFGKRSVHFDPFKAFVYISRSVKHRQLLLAINSSLMVSMRKIHLPFSHVLKQPWGSIKAIFSTTTQQQHFSPGIV